MLEHRNKRATLPASSSGSEVSPRDAWPGSQPSGRLQRSPPTGAICAHAVDQPGSTAGSLR